MNRYPTVCLWMLLLSFTAAQAQTPSIRAKKPDDKPVKGSGTAGNLTKWTSPETIGDSIVTESNGNIGIGTTTPGSKLTVAGRIEAFTTGVIPAVLGQSPGGSGVRGNSDTGFGVFGSSTAGNGMQGLSSSGNGIFGHSLTGNGVRGDTGNSGTAGVFGVNSATGGYGVLGQAFDGTGVRGISSTGFGVVGSSSNSFGAGVSGFNFTDGIGVSGQTGTGLGVFGASQSGVGVLAQSTEGTAVMSITGTGSAGEFIGDVSVSGTLTKGGGSFKIDHPLDPANRNLSHSFVESPDMMNIYNGNVTTDANGEATVALPAYFAALNRDFRYQLTVIGQFAQAIVSSEISDNRFEIKTDKPTVKVSWQVTGIRQDAWANKNRIPVEEPKPDRERGFLHPSRTIRTAGREKRRMGASPGVNESSTDDEAEAVARAERYVQ